MNRPTDHELDLSVAAMLRFGVTLAAIVVLAGGILSMHRLWSPTPNYSHFHAGGETHVHFLASSTVRFIWTHRTSSNSVFFY
jgi:hypothetical protein